MAANEAIKPKDVAKRCKYTVAFLEFVCGMRTTRSGIGSHCRSYRLGAQQGMPVKIPTLGDSY